MLNYTEGLKSLKDYLQKSEDYSQFLVLEFELFENLENENFLGSTEQSRRDRYRIIDQLNKLALKHINFSFTDLCTNEMNVMKRDHLVKLSILFLTADPLDSIRLRIGEEFREIQEKLQLAKLRNRFVLEQRTSVRSQDLIQSMMDVKPNLVHFAGHGMSNGSLYIENRTGETHLISPNALAQLFEQFKHQVQCVVLNICHSEIPAKAIARHIKYVIGINNEITDEAAIAYVIGFYQGLGNGYTIEESHMLGRTHFELRGFPKHQAPMLYKE